MAKVFSEMKRGGRRVWRISYVGLEGWRHRERTTATTKEEAQALLNQKLSEITKAKLTGVQSLQALKHRLFEDFLREEFMPHCRATHTPATFRSDLSLEARVKKTFGRMSLRSITAGDLQRYIDQRAGALKKNGKPIRPATVNREAMFIAGVLSEALKRGYIDRHPVKGVRMLREHNDQTRYLTANEEERLVAFLPDYLLPIVQTALHTGMRLGEIRNLRWVDLDREQRLLRVSQTKNHRTRHVPINDDLWEVLEHLYPFTGPKGPSPFIFTNPKTGTAYKTLSHEFSEVCDKVGLQDVTFHVLRHTAASRMTQAGVQMKAVQEILGHSSLLVTQRYAHLSPRNLRDAVDALSRCRFGVLDGTSTAQAVAAEMGSR